MVGEENHMMVGEESHMMVGEERHMMVGEENHMMVGEENHMMVGEERHMMVGEENHMMVGEGNHMMVGEENHMMVGEENHMMVGEESHMMVGEENHMMVGEENHMMVGEENHMMVGEENHMMVGEERHMMVGEENHMMVGEERHMMVGEENHMMVGEENHRMVGEENHRMVGEESHMMVGEENHMMVGEENHMMVGEESHMMVGEENRRSKRAVGRHNSRLAIRIAVRSKNQTRQNPSHSAKNTSAVLECFNIDTAQIWSYSLDGKSHFGQKVLQYSYESENGSICCQRRPHLREANTQLGEASKKTGTDSNAHFHKEESSGHLLQTSAHNIALYSRSVCQQRKGRKARSTTEELNGVCTMYMNGTYGQVYTDLAKTAHNYLVEKNKNNNNNCRRSKPFPNTGISLIGDSPKTKNLVQENTNNNNNVEEEDDESGTEIAIVLDGSGSISPEDFQRAKDFISNMMKMVWDKCLECEFAVVQYGSEIKTVFDLQESRESKTILDKVQNISQLGNVTKTASALLHVLNSIFSESHGSKENATKIILVLTDGDIFMDPVNLTYVMSLPEMKNIERFAIGVGSAFNSTKAHNELKLIASSGDEHLIRVGDYSALNGLLSALQQKIVGIEGTKGDALEFDLAETGIAVHLKDKHTLMLGLVGALDWSGGLLIYQTDSQPHKVDFLSEPKDISKTNYSYLGYSVTYAQGKHLSFYVAGAPRHSSVGKVLVFERDITSYHLIQYLRGEQLGSYFGYELCSLDLTSDGTTDFLLVAAPFYHIKGEEGRVYIYELTDESNFVPVSTLEQQYYSFARFGYSIASIGDINQDGFQDIAIGAPLEGHFELPDSFGSVYIYNSHISGIHCTHSQRIRATDLSMKLQYFGQSIDGGIDLTDDGYPDLSVGSLRNVTVLRSRPVVKLQTYVTFLPDKIPLINTIKNMSASVCFDIKPFNYKEFIKTHLSYTVDLDVHAEQKRVTFEKEDSPKGKLHLIAKKCADLILYVLPCNYDCFSSVIIKISYKLESDLKRDLPAPILDVYNTAHTYVELPYEKDCDNKPICVPNLHLNTSLSGKELVVGDTKYLVMNLSLANSGDGSYMTNVLVVYPKNLNFKKVETPNFPSIKCSDPTVILPLDSSLNCSIGHPVFKKPTAAFSIIWQLNEEKFPKEKAIISLNVSKSKPTIYVNVSQESTQNKEIQYTFNINGENQFEAELFLNLQMPIQIQGSNIATVTHIQKTQLIEDSEDLMVTGKISYNDLFVDLKQKDHQAHVSITLLKVKDINILPVVIGSSIGGILLLLTIVIILVKCGFFKRKYKNFEQE
ncbi:integrin alpha-E [Rhinophrynus dorsalis]